MGVSICLEDEVLLVTLEETETSVQPDTLEVTLEESVLEVTLDGPDTLAVTLEETVLEVNLYEAVLVDGGAGFTGVLHISAQITNTSAPVTIGAGQISLKATRVVVDVAEPFDGVTMTIGTDTAQACLMTAAENRMDTPGVYETDLHYTMTGAEMFRAWFTGVSDGWCSIDIFFN